MVKEISVFIMDDFEINKFTLLFLRTIEETVSNFS